MTATISQPRLTSNAYIIISLLIHLALIAYGEYHDRHFIPRYTDVDYRVVSDAVQALWDGKSGRRAEGWLTKRMGWDIGDPYARATYRYTPLLAVLFSPIHVNPLAGKLTIAFSSLLTSYLLTSPTLSPSFHPHLLWSLNPFVLNINTRGSAESILVVLVALSLVLIEQKKEVLAAVVWGLAVHWKIYPIVYGAAFVAVLHQRDGGRWVSWRKIRFGLISGGTFALLGASCWAIWGQTFLDHTYLYHINRLDHRHNFSPYFYPIYLSLFSTPSSSTSATAWDAITNIASHPLASFIPQMSLTILSGFMLPPRTSLKFAMFVQTWVFVMFNKVCTSQYFMWWIFLLPSIIPHLHMSRIRALILGIAWVGSQALWLSTAYRLEFKAESVYLPLWVASIAFFLVNGWILVEILAAYEAEVPPKVLSRVEKQGVSSSADKPAVSSGAANAGSSGAANPGTSSGSHTDKTEEPWQTPKKRRHRKRSSGGPASPSSPSSAGTPVPASPTHAVEDAINGTKWKHASKVAD